MYWQILERFTNDTSNLNREDRPIVSNSANIYGSNVGGGCCLTTQSAMGQGGEIQGMGTSHKVCQGTIRPGFSTCGVAQATENTPNGQIYTTFADFR